MDPTQPVGLSLKRNAAWMCLGEGGYAAAQLAIFVILARLGGPALVGVFTLALAVTAPIMVFSQLEMRQIQAVDAAGRYGFADYRAVRLGTTALALLVIAAVVALGDYAAPVAAVILAVGLVRAVENLSDIYYGLAQRHERLDRVAQSMLLRNATGCVALGLVLVLTGSLVVGLLSQAAVWAAIWWLFDRRVTRPWWGGSGAVARRVLEARAARGRLQLAWLGLPLGGKHLLVILNANVPRYMIGGFMGLDALGIFAALASVVAAGNTVIFAICHAASPRLANLFAQGMIGPYRRFLLQLCGIGALLGLAGALVAFLFGAPLLQLVYGEVFSAHARLLVWIMIVNAIFYCIAPLGYSLSAMHRFRVQPAIQGAAVGVNALACLVLVPHYGLTGAVGGWGLGLVCQALISFLVNARCLRHAAGRAEVGRAVRLPRHPA